MSSKKPPTQPQKLVEKKTNPPQVQKSTDTTTSKLSVVETTPPVKEEVYTPPKTVVDKVPDPVKYKIQYKILAFRNDYIKLQEQVSDYLNQGWKLVGGVSVSMNVSQYESVTIFSQAIIKE